MSLSLKLAALAASALALSAMERRDAKKAMDAWPAEPVLAAQAMIDKYGPPDEASPEQLVWRQRAGWLKIVVRPDRGLAPDGDLLEQSVAYPNERSSWWDVEALGIGVHYEPVGKILTASSSSEARNFLALNLAADVLEGRRTPVDADAFYRRTLDLAASGKTSPYMTGLLFGGASRTPARQPGQLLPLP